MSKPIVALPPASSTQRDALSASGVYFVFQGLRMTAGLVSLPLLTRALSKEEYGLLNLIFALVGILALVGRLGFAEATTRFYFERSQQGARSLREFCGAMLSGVLASSSAVALVTFAAVSWLGSDPNTVRCVRLACLVVIIRAGLGVLYQIYRAQTRPLAHSMAQLATRYLPLVIVLALVLFTDVRAYEVVLATVIGEACVALVCLSGLVRGGVVGAPALGRLPFNAAFVYGMPLAVGTYATFLLDYGDRFLIERFLGLDAVASYAVPYDLVQTCAAATFGSLNLALMPIIFRLWESDGREATSAFVSQVLSYSVALAIPAAVLLVAVSHDLIVLLTSSKYGGSAALIPYLLPGVFMGEMNFLMAAGLMLSRGTVALAGLNLASGVLNVLFNLVLLPLWGLRGAAVATTMAYGFLMLGTYLLGRHVLDLRMKPMLLGAGLVTTAIMTLSLQVLGHVSTQPVFDLFVRGAVGATVAALCMSVLSPGIRQHTWTRIGRKTRLGTAGG